MNLEPSCQNHDEFETCGVWFRPVGPTQIKELGDKIDGHSHHYDHAMLVVEGECDIIGRYKDGTLAFNVHLKAKDVYPVQKEIEHEIIPTVLPYYHFCIFPSRLPSGHVSGENTGFVRATH